MAVPHKWSVWLDRLTESSRMLAELREEANLEKRFQLAIDASDILTRTQKIAKKIRDIREEKR